MWFFLFIWLYLLMLHGFHFQDWPTIAFSHIYICSFLCILYRFDCILHATHKHVDKHGILAMVVVLKSLAAPKIKTVFKHISGSSITRVGFFYNATHIHNYDGWGQTCNKLCYEDHSQNQTWSSFDNCHITTPNILFVHILYVFHREFYCILQHYTHTHDDRRQTRDPFSIWDHPENPTWSHCYTNPLVWN